MAVAGYFASILIGISLGLIGGGGSILTVPVLVYLFGVDALLATTYSLFIVGITSIAGSAAYFRKGLVDLRSVVLFGIPSVAAVLLPRRLLVPAIPEVILQMGALTLTRSMLLMVLFAALMVLAAFSMMRTTPEKRDDAGKRASPLPVMAQGLAVGAVTGLVGAGGGFLIIPALVHLLKLPIKTAIGTSLVIISINSLSGFLGAAGNPEIRWPFLLTIAAIAMVGIMVGSYLSGRIDGKKLKPAFGWFVLAMGTYILLRETLFR